MTNLYAEYLIQNGEYDKAIATQHKALSMMDGSTAVWVKSLARKNLADAYDKAGNHDSALYYLKEYLMWNDSVEKQLHRHDIMMADIDRTIEAVKAQTSVEVEKSRRIMLITIGTGILIVIAAYILFIKHKTKQRLQQIETDAELQQTRYRIATRAALLEEERQLITSIRNLVRDSDTDNGLADKIENALKIHDIGNSERESLINVHDKLSPDFHKQLKNRHPELTEAQIRMSQYITIGMSNRQIAQLLNITYESVKK